LACSLSAANATAILVKRINRLKAKSIFFFYRLLQAVLSPLVLLYFLLRCIQNRRYFPTLSERLGLLPREYQQTVCGAIWFHAVSVGEVIAISPLVDRLRQEFPCAPIFISTATLAGYTTATSKFKTNVFYAPLDYVFAVRHVLRTIRPSLLVVAETEIWPNLFRETKRTACGLAIVNGRISDKMAPTYQKWCWFFRHVLSHCDRIVVQSEEQRARFLAAGAPPERVSVGGNIKYDFNPFDSSAWLADFKGDSKLWIAASTTADDRVAEEDFVINCAQHLSGWKVVIAPRKPDRFEEVAHKLERSGLTFSRRSKNELFGDVLLLDTIGELSGIFGLADTVFMGGSLAERGGHNILEPAYFSRPIVVGPHMENFREIADEFRHCSAFIEIQGPSDLKAALLRASVDPLLGQRAKACADARRGAVDRVFTALNTIYRNATARYRRSLPGILFLWPFAQLWCLFRRRPVREQESLGVRVVSVGNITVGGTGKTPLVQYVAERFKDRGYRPGILSRGHGRSSHLDHLLLEPHAEASVIHTGDEAQIFLRSGVAYVGIGKDRITTGRLLKEKFNIDAFILDDGFQQFRLARDLDLVLIDAMNPFGDENLVPLGRLREPLLALQRASAFVITRTECNRPVDGIERRLREHNAHAPIFRSRVVPEAWVNYGTGETYPPTEIPFLRPLAFCGLGNPLSFWRTLDQLGIHPKEKVEFDDHHRYSAREIRRMGLLVKALNLDALLTTEKDVVNFCESTESIVAPAQVLWLKIGLEIDKEAEFLKLLFP
jgi:3-deoxy-D-manno-octulosonic-acid transferase